MIQPSMERTATAPVEVRVSEVVAAGGAGVEEVLFAESAGGSMSISVEAMVGGRYGVGGEVCGVEVLLEVWAKSTLFS